MPNIMLDLCERTSRAQPKSAAEFYVIYDHPRDYPNDYVVRRWSIIQGIPSVDRSIRFIAPDLAAARASIPEGCVNVGRMAQDDPAILEVWV